MKRLSALAALALLAAPAAAQSPPAPLPSEITLADVLRIVESSPRVAVSAREADIARAERAAAGALPNPTLSLGRSRPAGGERTMFDANSQDQAMLELPVPIFGQRGARMRAADFQVERAQSQLRLTLGETRRLSALAFLRLLGAQETQLARRAAAADVERIRTLVAGRQASGMASRYDAARADAEAALANLGVQRAATEVNEQAATLAGLVDARGWRPRARGSLAQLRTELGEPPTDLAANAALRAARDETAAAEARIELARRERYPVPAVQLGRAWTSGPFGAANFVGVTSEIPILDTRRAGVDRAVAEHGAARERERGVAATVQAELGKQREALELRREALARFERDVFERQSAFLEMAESAYRLGKGTLFELLDARRTQLEASVARVELLTALLEAELELRALAGEL
ncbi:MAG: TolC family protein [Betaproteobacteria bacterium]|nr:TolC family protein [Betaproteobacteria bacterium]